MIIEDLHARLMEHANKGLTAIVSQKSSYSYEELLSSIENMRCILKKRYSSKRCIIIKGDYGIDSIAMFWAGLLEAFIVLPQTHSSLADSVVVEISDADLIYDAQLGIFSSVSNTKSSKGIHDLIACNHAGIIILSSGSTGNPKAVLHDADKLLSKYKSSRKGYTTLATMLFDHIAGIDIMLYTLCAGGTLVVSDSRNPQKLIDTAIAYRVEVIPASPSLLQLMLIEESFRPECMPNLKIITFGSEFMTDTVKERVTSRFQPHVTVAQKYGITEIGNPATVTKKDDPSYFKFKEGLLEYKIVNDVLHIKSMSSMLGYLYRDHVEAFDGWFDTQDKVEVDGVWIKILGRVTDIINVGGQKVYPSEVESVLQSMDNVKDAAVYGSKNPIMGSVVSAKVSLNEPENLAYFKKRMRVFCKSKLEPYKVPVSVEIVDYLEMSGRYKKVRK
ncbi:MAG: fatty acid--CoA ligase family protein [Bacteroidales bacterium]|nr:fatty acid--CoA ligase family protein [Bacteroidales bacterium]